MDTGYATKTDEPRVTCGALHDGHNQSEAAVVVKPPWPVVASCLSVTLALSVSPRRAACRARKRPCRRALGLPGSPGAWASPRALLGLARAPDSALACLVAQTLNKAIRAAPALGHVGVRPTPARSSIT